MRRLTCGFLAAMVIATLFGSADSLRAQQGPYASMAVDMVADGQFGDVQSSRSLTSTSGPFDVEFEIEGDFGPTGLGTFAFDLDYPQELIVPSGEFRVNGAWSESGGGQTICALLQKDIGDGVARLACNLAESFTGATQPGVMATLQFSVVPGASGCGELQLLLPEAAIANGGSTYDLREARGASIAVNRSDCPGVLDATPPPAATPGPSPTAGLRILGPDELTATAAAENGTPLDTPVPGASPTAGTAPSQTSAPNGTQASANATSVARTPPPVLGPTDIAVAQTAEAAAGAKTAAARIAASKSSGGGGLNGIAITGIVLVALAVVAGGGLAGYWYRKRS